MQTDNRIYMKLHIRHSVCADSLSLAHSAAAAAAAAAGEGAMGTVRTTRIHEQGRSALILHSVLHAPSLLCPLF